MTDSIFTKILHGEIPGHVIYQDDTTFVILTIDPLSTGHMLVIPKLEVDHLWDLDDTTYHHLFDVARQMQAKLKTAYPDYERIGLIVEGFGVAHAHIHVFGCNQPLEKIVADRIDRKSHGENLVVSPETLQPIAEKLRAV